MPRRGENIHKRKDGRWEGRYQKGRDEHGKIIYGSVYGQKYQEVKEKLTMIHKNMDCTISRPYKKEKFSEVLQLWLDTNQIRQKGATVRKYRYIIEKHILPELGSIEISQLNATMINSFLQRKLESGRIDQGGGLSPSYVRTITLIITGALKFAVEEQMCSPLKSKIYKPSMTRKEVVALSPAEQTILEKFLSAHLSPTAAGILLSLYTGLRIGEVCALSWEDIDFTQSILHVRHTIARVNNSEQDLKLATKLIIDTPKTKTSLRDIPLSHKLKSILYTLYQTTHSDYVISTSREFVSPRTYDYRYHQILKECGLPPVNYHVLRHTFATRCIESGIDAKSLSEILGHSNVSITLNTYVHSSMELKRMQLEKMSELFIENGQENGIEH